MACPRQQNLRSLVQNAFLHRTSSGNMSSNKSRWVGVVRDSYLLVFFCFCFCGDFENCLFGGSSVVGIIWWIWGS